MRDVALLEQGVEQALQAAVPDHPAADSTVGVRDSQREELDQLNVFPLTEAEQFREIAFCVPLLE